MKIDLFRLADWLDVVSLIDLIIIFGVAFAIDCGTVSGFKSVLLVFLTTVITVAILTIKISLEEYLDEF